MTLCKVFELTGDYLALEYIEILTTLTMRLHAWATERDSRESEQCEARLEKEIGEILDREADQGAYNHSSSPLPFIGRCLCDIASH